MHGMYFKQSVYGKLCVDNEHLRGGNAKFTCTLCQVHMYFHNIWLTGEQLLTCTTSITASMIHIFPQLSFEWKLLLAVHGMLGWDTLSEKLNMNNTAVSDKMLDFRTTCCLEYCQFIKPWYHLFVSQIYSLVKCSFIWIHLHIL